MLSVCVCVCERERERERDLNCLLLYISNRQKETLFWRTASGRSHVKRVWHRHRTAFGLRRYETACRRVTRLTEDGQQRFYLSHEDLMPQDDRPGGDSECSRPLRPQSGTGQTAPRPGQESVLPDSTWETDVPQNQGPDTGRGAQKTKGNKYNTCVKSTETLDIIHSILNPLTSNK